MKKEILYELVIESLTHSMRLKIQIHSVTSPDEQFSCICLEPLLLAKRDHDNIV